MAAAEQTLEKFYSADAQQSRGQLIFGVLLGGLILSAYLMIDLSMNAALLIQKPFPNWVQWLIAAAGGTLLYLLWETSKRFRHIAEIRRLCLDYEHAADGSVEKSLAEKNAKRMFGMADFLAYTPWYVTIALRGPIIVMVVMFTLTNVTFATSLQPPEAETTSPTGAAVDAASTDESSGKATQPLELAIELRGAPQLVKVVFAFLLGIFNRLPYHMLEEIAKRLFGAAWKRAGYDHEEENNGDNDPDNG